MQKKVRILMVLLCLFLFPLKVFALEEAVGTEVNESNDDVAIIETVSDKIDEIVHAAEGEESDADLIDASETVDVNDDQKVENETPTEEVEVTEEVTASIGNIQINAITINNVNRDLTAGSLPTFSGTISTEEEGYNLLYEQWEGQANDDQDYGVYTSDAARNTEIEDAGDTLLTTTYADSYYTYGFAIKVHSGYTLAAHDNEYEIEVVDVVVDGQTMEANFYLQASLDDGDIFLIQPNIYIKPVIPGGNYIDSVEFENVNYNITVGKAPTYTATVAENSKDYVTIGSEVWTYETTYVDDEETYYAAYDNFSNSKFEEGNTYLFETFEEGNTYYHVIIFSLKDNYLLKTYYAENGYPYHKVIVNGVEYQIMAFGFTWFQDDDTVFYYVESPEDGVVPATETYTVLEGGNSTISSDDTGDLDLVVDADGDLFDKLIIDNNVVTDNFTAGGSEYARITLKNALLKTLGAGAHDIILTFLDGKSAYTTLTIEEAIQEVTDNPVAAATSNSLVYYSYADETETTSLAEKEDQKDDSKDAKKTEKKDNDKKEKPEKEKVEKTNPTFYIILVALFLIIVAVPFVVDRKKQ